MVNMGRMAFIGFSTPKSFNLISWLIRKITQSQCSHAWAVFHSELDDCDMVREAHEFGFRQVTLEFFKKTNTIVQMIPLDVDASPGLRMLGHRLGQPYDFPGLLSMAPIELFRWLGHRFKWWHYQITRPWHWANSMMCSEAMVEFLQACGSRMSEDLIPNMTSPQDLMDALNGKV